MRSSPVRSLSLLLAIFVVHAASARQKPPAPPPTQPTIGSFRGGKSGVTVTVHVPKGVKRVTLQSFDGKNWVARAVAHVDGSGQDVTFQIPQGVNKNKLRVTGDTTDPLSASLFAGQTNFAKTSSTQPATPSASSSIATAGGVTTAANTPNLANAAGNATVQRTVTESDIWKISGNTLYFFNQYRGLQIIDITNPDAPVRLGTLHLPAVGEDMYVLDDSHVVLLARSGTSWDQSEVIVVAISKAAPTITASLPVNGYVDTSRLVGTALYVASEAWQTSTNGSQWGTQLSSFDLSNPDAPVARGTLWFDGWNNSATATDSFFFAATTSYADWSHSQIHVVDISAADGTMATLGTIQTAGVVADKFKMGLNGSTFTAISQVWPSDNNAQPSSELETFSLADPSAPAKLGDLSFGAGDQLYATRFDGSRAYVVTAQQIDPLWIIDLSDPANPSVAGQVDAPGFSTFIQPLGDRVVTLGIVGGLVAVSLFDVTDPTAPALLTQLPIGGTYSWSAANWDEKAFSVLPDSGLILVPVNSYDPQTGSSSQVQLIDLASNSLAKRGVINHQFEPRRATAFASRILSISGWELLTVDATDRDSPKVTSDVALAWTVDRVFAQGDYLIEITDGGGWGNQNGPSVRVALASDPDQIVSETDIDGAPIRGATVGDGRLYIAQADGQGVAYPLSPIVPLAATANANSGAIVSSPGGNANSATATLTVSIYDLSSLPQISLLGQTQTQIASLGWSPSLEALWPKAGVLVWSTNGRGTPWPIYWEGPIGISRLPVVTLAGGGTAVSGGALTINGTQTAAGTTSGQNTVTLSGSGLTLNGAPTLASGVTVSGGASLSLSPHVATAGGATLTISPSSGASTSNTSTTTIATTTIATGTISGGTLTLNGGSAVSALPIAPWWWGGGSQGRLLAFDVSAPATPQFLSETKFAADAWSVGSAFAGDGAIYASHAGAVQFTDTTGGWSWVKPNSALPIFRGWAQGWYLDVIDFTTPAAPVVRDPVSIPSSLAGVSNATAQSALLFSVGFHVQDTNAAGQYLDASAYDGASASLVDSVPLAGWSNPAVVDGGNVLVGASTVSTGGEIDTWSLSDAGKLTQLGSIALDGAPYDLRAFGNLLAAQLGQKIELFDKTNPASLQQIGGSDPSFGLYLILDHADGDVTRGLWAPLGDYGVEVVGVNP
jgi:hypothetical protein